MSGPLFQRIPERGDCTLPTPLNVPAPTPTPTPPSDFVATLRAWIASAEAWLKSLGL